MGYNCAAGISCNCACLCTLIIVPVYILEMQYFKSCVTKKGVKGSYTLWLKLAETDMYITKSDIHMSECISLYGTLANACQTYKVCM